VSRRPADWSPLADRDPVPGDPERFSAIVTNLIGIPTKLVARRRETITDVDGLSNGELALIRLQVYVPLPRSAEMLLSFSTPVDPLANAMVSLFDAIAASLHWRHA
jgi:hypothetical protein